MLTITFGFSGGTSRTISLLETQSAGSQTLAIQTALDAVAGHDGGFVTLSGGTFTVTGTGKASDGALRVGSDTVLSGAGIGSTVLKLAAGSSAVTGVVRTDSGGTNPDGSVKTTANVRIENLTIDGNKAQTSGDAGSDTLTGGTGSDVFAFQSQWGSDVVTDFRNGAEKFDLSGVAGLTKFAQLSVTQTGADVRIAHGSDSILLKSIAASAVDATDFIFA